MKKVGFITKNKMLMQSLHAATEAKAQADFELLAMLNYKQAALDAEVLAIDVAVVDGNHEIGTALQLCGRLRSAAPSCKILFMISQTGRADSEIAVAAKRVGRIDDFLFYDSSLEYLIAKLSSM